MKGLSFECFFIILPLFITLSCINDNNLGYRKQCDCSLREFADSYSDTSWVNVENTPFSAGAELKIKGVIRKLVDAEISANITSEEKITEYKKILTSVSNDYPEHDNFILLFRLKRLIYCEYYERICKNTKIANEEMDIRLEKKITELDALINNYFDFNPPQSKSNPSRDAAKAIIQNKCSIFSGKDAINYSNSFKNIYRYLYKYGIIITYSPDGFGETKYSGRYFYNGGYVTIRFNNKDIPLPEFKLQPQSRQGNPKNIVEEAIEINIAKSINMNRQTFENLIKNTICK